MARPPPRSTLFPYPTLLRSYFHRSCGRPRQTRTMPAGVCMALRRRLLPTGLHFDGGLAANLHEHRDRAVLALEGQADLHRAIVRLDVLQSAEDGAGDRADRIIDQR